MTDFTCEICKITYRKINNDEWNNKKAAEEFLTLTPECKNDPTAQICDYCFQIYKAWLSKQSDEDKKRMRNENV